MKGESDVNRKKNPNPVDPLHKTEQEKTEEYINVFNYFEDANAKNREAFAELLDYTSRNQKK